MNDLAFFQAVRRLPARCVRPGLNVTRFGEGAKGRIVATHAAILPAFPTMVYRDGRWRKDDPHGPVARGAR